MKQTKKKSFLLYQDQEEVVNSLTDAQAGQLFKAIFKYNKGENPQLDPILKIVFIPIRQALDRDEKKYQEICQKNRKNIIGRWHNKRDAKHTTEYDRIRPNTTGYEAIRSDTKHTDTDNDNDNDNDKVKNKIIPKGITRKPREYGSPEINSLIKFFKERFGLPLLDGSEQQNRRYCHLAMVKFGGADKVRLLIETAANSDFWSTKISSFMDLYYKGVRIINETRSIKGVGVIS